MAKVTVDGTTFEVEDNKRLVLALEEHGIDILHRCGGIASCTTCRVKFRSGEPTQMTQAERNRLRISGLLGIARLSCQILCQQDMEVEVLMRVSNTEYESAGQRPQPEITPEPKWINRPY
ncbi:MAG: (2Fe-2S)-binding protein [Phototrophicales bacterium]|nr:MAG: (2Fe-2S)-binding protein [Phototrophicales bacterium]